MKIKSFVAVAMALLLLLLPTAEWGAGGPIAAAKNEVKVTVNGKLLALTQAAYSDNGVTVGPVREIAAALGAEISHASNADGSITIRLAHGSRSVSIATGSLYMTVGSESVQLQAAPRIEGNATFAPIRALFEALGFAVSWDNAGKTVLIHDGIGTVQLPAIGTTEKLAELLKQINRDRVSIQLEGGGWGAEGEIAEATGDFGAADGGSAAPAAESPATEKSLDDVGSPDHSTTNVQVEGVDEADWAKTDGNYIYQISGNRILIADISDPTQPRLAAILEYNEKDGFHPQELYIDGSQVIVIGQSYTYIAYDMPADAPAPEARTEAREGSGGSSSGSQGGSDTPTPSVGEGEALAAIEISAGKQLIAAPDMRIWPPVQTRSTTTTLVYELDGQGNATLVRELSQEGGYLSSRKIGSSLYVITNKYNYYYPLYEKFAAPAIIDDGGTAIDAATVAPSAPGDAVFAQEIEKLETDFKPVYSDTTVSDELQSLPLDRIYYFPEPADTSMMLVGAVDLAEPGKPLEVSAYLGSGQTIYASQKHLYVALSKYEQTGDSFEATTQFHKFRLDRGSVAYAGEGSVPGTLLNQFSMDEHNGYFRVALTKGNMWGNGSDQSTSQLFVLDETMTTVGKLDGLAPGERIYSVRFMGDRAYMVTFRNVDPLFVIELANPAEPKVLGQLKIPGYSDYLHPYDENHVIGFGMDTALIPSKGSGPDDVIAVTKGMKMAIFDVSDVANPKEKFTEMIGDRGTHSEVLYNHKALLFSREKGLLAFPVQLHEVKGNDKTETGGFPAYGEFTFQGALIYAVDADNGFRLRGRISHLSDEDMLKSGHYGYNYGKTVRRILYAGDTLYTLSDAMLKANDMNSLSERGSLVYPAAPDHGYGWRDGGGVMPMPEVIVE